MHAIPIKYSTAIEASIQASQAIMAIYRTDFQATSKEDGSPVTQADLESSQIIHSALEPLNIPITSEEQSISSFEERQHWKESWCIDPLDGTRMFLRKNGEFCISIAHIIDRVSVFGILTSPTQREILFGGPQYGVFNCSFEDFLFPEKWIKIEPKTHVNNPMTVVCSRSYTHGSGFKYMQILESTFGELHYLRKGSAMKFFDLARGKADIYPRFAPTMEWDIAAGHAILNALGGEIVDVDNNKPLHYNKESLYNPRFIAKTKAIIEQ